MLPMLPASGTSRLSWNKAGNLKIAEVRQFSATIVVHVSPSPVERSSQRTLIRVARSSVREYYSCSHRIQRLNPRTLCNMFLRHV